MRDDVCDRRTAMRENVYGRRDVNASNFVEKPNKK